MKKDKYSWPNLIEATQRDKEEVLALREISSQISNSNSIEFLLLSKLIVLTLMKFDEPNISLKALLGKIKSKLGAVKNESN